MTTKYVVNVERIDDEGYRVHTDWCAHLPPPEDQFFLGHFEDCWGAIKRAKIFDIHATACPHCCKECHV